MNYKPLVISMKSNYNFLTILPFYLGEIASKLSTPCNMGWRAKKLEEQRDFRFSAILMQ